MRVIYYVLYMVLGMDCLIEFIEKYCLINNKHIKLTDHQKKFLVWLLEYKDKKFFI
jgi:hypothetical protein